MVKENAIPGFHLMKATKGSEDYEWPIGWYGLVQMNDQTAVFKDLVRNVIVDDETISEEEERFWETVDSFTMNSGYLYPCYELVKACVDVGYDPKEHGYNVEAWLIDYLAKTVDH